ncbi:class I SAM-dependent methyltransferase [Roseibium sp.]|uniref:class I SAM-dependent methyltransferase n=1 Tax=Roseibium sp. TaxID=1936156 RepID=UPI003B52A62B
MSGFSAEWLALREPLDLASRNKQVEDAFFAALPDRELKVLDLASGAGSTVAALSRPDTPAISWTLADYDAELLTIAASRRYDKTPANLATVEADLAEGLDRLPLSEVDAVTTSAFLDLASEDFLQRLVDAVTSAGKPFLASLTYDGRATFEPADPLDVSLREALNIDQQTDKGFGPALGPQAARRAIDLFTAKGYFVQDGASDWQIEPGAANFLKEFLSGWARVGCKQGLDPAKVDRWLEFRSQQIAEKRLSMMVGHLDFVALPKLQGNNKNDL